MIRSLLLLLFITLSMHAKSLSELRANLISIIATKIISSSSISIYVDDMEFKDVKWESPIRRVSNCYEADLIILPKWRMLTPECEKKALILLTNYKEYKTQKNAIGAIFWQKGRSQLVLNDKKLNELSINLGDEFEPYIE